MNNPGQTFKSKNNGVFCIKPGFTKLSETTGQLDNRAH